jgi:hypothetical protein
MFDSTARFSSVSVTVLPTISHRGVGCTQVVNRRG